VTGQTWPEGTPAEVIAAAALVDVHQDSRCPDCSRPGPCPALIDARRTLARRAVQLETVCLPCGLAGTSGAQGHPPCSGVQLVGGSYCGCACRERAGLEPARVPPVDPKLV
jgi:hypothetical protein